MTESTARTKRILVTGGGGRENALAVALSTCSGVAEVIVCPGNGGTFRLGNSQRALIRRHRSPPMSANDWASLAKELSADLVVVGPEAHLAAGVVDACVAADIRVFGPTQSAARIESSKHFCKEVLLSAGVKTAAFDVVSDENAARDACERRRWRVALKADGLASGKGVFVCDNEGDCDKAIASLFVDKAVGVAAATVIVEDRLEGPELSVLGLCDGKNVRLLPAARDYKRLLDDDLGPNTGGMGAFSPVPGIDDAFIDELTASVFQPVLAELAKRDAPFVGVLYAGLMLTDDGPHVLEFNARFGDPETAVVLPRVRSDLLTLMEACIDGDVDQHDIEVCPDARIAVVCASEGYPNAPALGAPIAALPDDDAHLEVVYAGVDWSDDRLVTAGGRVLAVVGRGSSIAEARCRAYRGVDEIRFSGVQFRRDIAHDLDAESSVGSQYERAGVSIDRATVALKRAEEAIRKTHTSSVRGDFGQFGGAFALPDSGHGKRVLVASTDGVGTKSMLAAKLGRWHDLGRDLVHHSINDILVQGAEPLFFLDYLAASRLSENIVVELISSCARACEEYGVALLGGETAEMPGVYADDGVDLVGTIVGMVDESAFVDGNAVQAGDLAVAIPSSGLHTNGYSLARRVVEGLALERERFDGRSLADLLMAPHRCYLDEVRRLRRVGVTARAHVHITGGGLIDNPPRILPDGLSLSVDTTSWKLPPIFEFLRAKGNIDDDEMRRVFNNGVGWISIVRKGDEDPTLAAFGEGAWVIGQVTPSNDGKKVIFA